MVIIVVRIISRSIVYSLVRWFFSNFDPSNPRNLDRWKSAGNPKKSSEIGASQKPTEKIRYPKKNPPTSLGLSWVFPIEPNAIRRQFWKFWSSEFSNAPLDHVIHIWKRNLPPKHPTLFVRNNSATKSTIIFWEQKNTTTKPRPKNLNSRDEVLSKSRGVWTKMLAETTKIELLRDYKFWQWKICEKILVLFFPSNWVANIYRFAWLDFC